MPNYTKRDDIAIKIINLAKAEILSRHPFLAEAAGRLTVEPMSLGKSLSEPDSPVQFTTDGERLGFNAKNVIGRFKETKGEAPKHDLLHTIVHCVFLHPFVGRNIDERLWNLAADIAAERIVWELLGQRSDPRGPVIPKTLAQIEKDLETRITAERVYAGFREGRWRNYIPIWETLFLSDEHITWYAPPDTQTGFGEGESERGEDDDRANERGEEPGSSLERRGQGDPPKENKADKAPDNPTGNDDVGGPETNNAKGDDDESSSSFQEANDQGKSGAPRSEGDPQDNPNPSGCASDATTTGEPSKNGKPDHGNDGAPGSHGMNNFADAPGEDPSSGNPMVRSQGKGAGNALTPYASERRGLGLSRFSEESLEARRSEWRNVATSLAVNLQTFSHQTHSALSGFQGDLELAAEKPLDYRDFLRKFAVPGEVMHLSNDEFDNVFYTYGMRLYGNLPLIEPLETREDKLIREFVIVIDTSGSVRGNVVRAFVDTTFDILKSTESFHERVSIRILQCDAAVQTDDKIIDLNQLEEWRRSMRIFGGGGTDFRPAFEYVDALIAQGEMRNLGGLIYFTDGWGVYPEWRPSYKTAFVFVDENHHGKDVPPWAITAVLDSESIQRASAKPQVERGYARVVSSHSNTPPISAAASARPDAPTS